MNIRELFQKLISDLLGYDITGVIWMQVPYMLPKNKVVLQTSIMEFFEPEIREDDVDPSPYLGKKVDLYGINSDIYGLFFMVPDYDENGVYIERKRGDMGEYLVEPKRFSYKLKYESVEKLRLEKLTSILK